MSSQERFWPSRLRWRMRGAWLWPAFVALTVLDGLLLHELPPVRLGLTSEGMTLIFSMIVATFGNLVLVGAVSPWLARRLEARAAADPQSSLGALPPEVRRDALRDRVGTALLALGVVGILAAGLGSREVVVSETEETERAARALHDYVQRSGDPELIRNNEAANTAKLGEGFFRTCIPRDERGRFRCFFLDAAKRPVEIQRDRSEDPNGPVGR